MHVFDPQWAIDVRPLERIDPRNAMSNSGPLVPDTIRQLAGTAEFDQAREYFDNYPKHSLMSPGSRALLFCLIRMTRPRVVGEIGTLFAGTSEVLARALWENGLGELHTTDPFGAERCPLLIDQWPEQLRQITSFYPDNSMAFFANIQHRRMLFDLVLVDGNHEFEYALFDLQMAAKVLRPGGVVVMDNIELSGPFEAGRQFLSVNSGWIELGDAMRDFDRSSPIAPRTSMPGTSFLLLQAPAFLSLENGVTRSWGQQFVEGSRLVGFALSLLPQDCPGTLHFRTYLRAYADGNRQSEELQTSGSLPISISGSPAIIEFALPNGMETQFPSRYPDSRQSVEIELVWQALDGGSAPLKLTEQPRPLF